MRSERSRRAVLDATFEIAARKGYTGLTIEAVAASAGVGKPTIYRWWQSKGVLALDAVNDRMGQSRDFPDTGDIVADLTHQANLVIEQLRGDAGTVFRGVIGAAQSDPDLAAAVRETILAPRISKCSDRLARAVAAGELRPDVPLYNMVELLYAPIYYRMLLGSADLSPHLTRARIEYTLQGLRPRP
ncbi:MAG: TetR/AcrR family transcriptional regulator [Nocardiopsaceae bacterium]|nr:TetR/AcrR family transcriptional regulator [Nocardiopsaceae bacterium]